MTKEEREFFRGWQAAGRDQPFDPYASLEWQEGYRFRINAKRRAA